MKTFAKKFYEGMFLVDSALAASDWDGVIGSIKTVLQRADAEVISIRKWDERRLEYAIKGKTRGTYILTYFKTEGPNIAGIERDVQLGEQIMRVLILQGEKMTPEDIEKATPADLAENRAEAEAAKAEADKVAAAEAAAAKAAEAPVEAAAPVEAEAAAEVEVPVEAAAPVEAEAAAEVEAEAPVEEAAVEPEKVEAEAAEPEAEEDKPAE